MFSDRKYYSLSATGKDNVAGSTQFSYENVSHQISTAAELKAKLLMSARKLREESRAIPYQVPSRVEEIRFNSYGAGAMTPRTQAKVDSDLENNVRRAIETQAKVVRELCEQENIDEARSSLGGLRRMAPEVTELAQFWEVAMLIEKSDLSRAAACMAFALQSVQRPEEKDRLLPILSAFLEMAAKPNQTDSLDVFFFPTGRRLSFQFPEANDSPQRKPSPIASYEQMDIVEPESEDVKPENEFVAKPKSVSFATSPTVVEISSPKDAFSLKSLLTELPAADSTPMVGKTMSAFPKPTPSSENREPKRTFRSTPFPKGFRDIDLSTSVLASPAMRVPTPKKNVSVEEEILASRPLPRLESRSPARSRLYKPDSELKNRGSVVVLSPVKESASSTKRVATPVRRSLRTATVTTEEKNKDALVRSDFSYVPNAALIPAPASPQPVSKEIKEIDTDGVRRSARKHKSVEKLSPKFGTKAYS